MLLAVGDVLKGTCQVPGSEAMFASRGAAFAGKLVLMKDQIMTRFPSIHAASNLMRGSVLGRQAPVFGRKIVALYLSALT